MQKLVSTPLSGRSLIFGCGHQSRLGCYMLFRFILERVRNRCAVCAWMHALIGFFLVLLVDRAFLCAEPWPEDARTASSSDFWTVSDITESCQHELLPRVQKSLHGTTDCSRHTSFFADLLLWNVREGSADNWAQEITPQGPGTSFGTATLVDAPFDWNAGVRIGLAKQVGYEEADVTFYYTNFSTEAKNQAGGEVYSAFLGNFFVGNPDGVDFGPHYQSATMLWDFDFHALDLEFGRKLTVSKSLTLRPFVGLKAAIINQFAQSHWHSPINTASQTYLYDSAVENLKHDFWGIGPSLGVAATAPIFKDQRTSLKFLATPSVALMYGHWQFDQRYQNDGPTSLTIPTPTSISIDMSPIEGAATMARGLLGIEWTQDFARSTTSLRLGYEAQVWLNQMQNYSFNMGRLNNLSSLQGGLLEISIDF
jgi:hypothetical protein